jgi:virulence-associated protein VapD
MGRPRKVRSDSGVNHNYPDIRQRRTTFKRSDGTVYQTKKREAMMEMQMKLMEYAPPHSAIYTITYNTSKATRYQFTDFFCINNHRLFKLTKIVAYILGYKLYKPRSKKFWGKDCMMVRTFREYQTMDKVEMVKIEIDLVKILSQKMFGNEDAYHHESLVMMQSQYDEPMEEIKKLTKKSYIVKSDEIF